MIVTQVNEHKRLFRFANTYLANHDARVAFGLCERMQILVGEAWEDVPEATKVDYKTVHLNNNTLVMPETGLLVPPGTEGAVGFYNWLLGMSATQVGMTDLGQIVFGAIAGKIETFLTDNGLWDA